MRWLHPTGAVRKRQRKTWWHGKRDEPSASGFPNFWGLGTPYYINVSAAVSAWPVLASNIMKYYEKICKAFEIRDLARRLPTSNLLHFLAFCACISCQIRVDFNTGSLNQAGIVRERHLYYENDAFDGSKSGDSVLSLFDRRAQQFRARFHLSNHDQYHHTGRHHQGDGSVCHLVRQPRRLYAIPSRQPRADPECVLSNRRHGQERRGLSDDFQFHPHYGRGALGGHRHQPDQPWRVSN